MLVHKTVNILDRVTLSVRAAMNKDLREVQTHDGVHGRHDNYGVALSAQSGRSQRRPAINSSSRLIVCIGLPALRASSAFVPMVAPYATM